MSTQRTCADQVSVSEEPIAFVAVVLLDNLFGQEFPFVQFEEYILGDLGVNLSTCSTEDSKVNIKPLIDIRMNLVVLLAYIFRSNSILKSLRLCCCSVLISPTYVD